ncbi:hypothetical protein MARINOS108_10629 [Marinoscillum sp. 108]|nr:hypothetical protein MARINOS108_10629 [Marinoscillum sp. 108]
MFLWLIEGTKRFAFTYRSLDGDNLGKGGGYTTSKHYLSQHR